MSDLSAQVDLIPTVEGGREVKLTLATKDSNLLFSLCVDGKTSKSLGAALIDAGNKADCAIVSPTGKLPS